MAGEPAELIGQTLNSTYRVTRLLGEGGMGAVYEASNTRLANKRYAVKLLHGAIAGNPEVFQRFRREAEIATSLGNDHIVDVLDFNHTEDGKPYMVMEYMDGEDLAGRISRLGPMKPADVMRVVKEICDGLDAAHKAGIVHRDLKPQNIFLCKKMGRDDFVKVLDFGVSKVHDSGSLVTRDNTLMGTPNYMSPEQADGAVREIDHRTDIFALGAIVWEMLTGEMCFQGPTVAGILYKVVYGDPAQVHTLRGDVPPAVSAVLNIAMAKKKTDRYSWVTELSKDLEGAFEGVHPQSKNGVPEVVAHTITGRAVTGSEASIESQQVAHAQTMAPARAPTPAPAVAAPAAAAAVAPPPPAPPRLSQAHPTTLSAAAAQSMRMPTEPVPPARKKSALPFAVGGAIVAIVAGAFVVFGGGKGDDATHGASPGQTTEQVVGHITPDAAADASLTDVVRSVESADAAVATAPPEPPVPDASAAPVATPPAPDASAPAPVAETRAEKKERRAREARHKKRDGATTGKPTKKRDGNRNIFD